MNSRVVLSLLDFDNTLKMVTEDLFEASEPTLGSLTQVLTEKHKLILSSHLEFIDEEAAIPAKIKEVCLKFSLQNFVSQTNLVQKCQVSGESPEEIYNLFKSSEVWPEKVHFEDLDKFLKSNLTWEEFENLKFEDISPRYLSFETVCSKTNFIDAVQHILEFKITLDFGRQVFEYCQNQNVWPKESSQQVISIASSCQSTHSSVPSVCSPFDPPITSTQDSENKSLGDSSKEAVTKSSKNTKIDLLPRTSRKRRSFPEDFMEHVQVSSPEALHMAKKIRKIDFYITKSGKMKAMPRPIAIKLEDDLDTSPEDCMKESEDVFLNSNHNSRTLTADNSESSKRIKDSRDSKQIANPSISFDPPITSTQDKLNELAKEVLVNINSPNGLKESTIQSETNDENVVPVSKLLSGKRKMRDSGKSKSRNKIKKEMPKPIKIENIENEICKTSKNTSSGSEDSISNKETLHQQETNSLTGSHGPVNDENIPPLSSYVQISYRSSLQENRDYIVENLTSYFASHDKETQEKVYNSKELPKEMETVNPSKLPALNLQTHLCKIEVQSFKKNIQINEFFYENSKPLMEIGNFVDLYSIKINLDQLHSCCKITRTSIEIQLSKTLNRKVFQVIESFKNILEKCGLVKCVEFSNLRGKIKTTIQETYPKGVRNCKAFPKILLYKLKNVKEF